MPYTPLVIGMVRRCHEIDEISYRYYYSRVRNHR